MSADVWAKDVTLTLNAWINLATEGLGEEAKRRVRAEITSHYEDHLVSLLASGSTQEEAHKKAVSALGEPRIAGKAFRRSYLTDWQEKFIDYFQHPIVKDLAITYGWMFGLCATLPVMLYFGVPSVPAFAVFVPIVAVPLMLWFLRLKKRPIQGSDTVFARASTAYLVFAQLLGCACYCLGAFSPDVQALRTGADSVFAYVFAHFALHSYMTADSLPYQRRFCVGFVWTSFLVVLATSVLWRYAVHAGLLVLYVLCSILGLAERLGLYPVLERTYSAIPPAGVSTVIGFAAAWVAGETVLWQILLHKRTKGFPVQTPQHSGRLMA